MGELPTYETNTPPQWLPKGCGVTEACVSCGLYNKTPSWSLPPVYDSNHNALGKLDRDWIAIINSYPSEAEVYANGEQSRGSYDLSTAKWKLPMVHARRLQSRWFATTALTCYPGKQEAEGKEHLDKVPTKNQLVSCAGQNLAYLLRKHKVKVIICLGDEAMHSVLGRYAPKKASSMGTTPFQIPGTDTIVFCLEHATKHYPKAKLNPKDLWPAYEEVFKTADQICLYGKREHHIDWYEVNDPQEALKIVRRMPTKFSFDVEDNHHTKDKTKTTVYHKDSKLLCLGLCFRNKETGKLEVPVLTGAAMLDKRVLEAIFTDRIASGYNVKYDITALRALAGFDVFRHVRRTTILIETKDGPREVDVPGINDPLVQIFLGNQGNTGKALSKIACSFWGITDWKLSVKYALADANKQIAENNAYVKNAQKKLAARDINNERLLSGDKKLISRAKKWFKDNPDLPSIDSLPEVRPLGSANFGDISMSILLPYNAADVYWEYRIGEEYVPTLQETQFAYSPTAYALMLRMIEVCCKSEHSGVALNQKRCDAAIEAVDKLVNETKLALLRQPEVRQAMVERIKLKKETKKPTWRINKDNLLSYLDPTASPFKIELAKALGDGDRLGITKSGAPGCPRAILNVLCGDERVGASGVKAIKKEALKDKKSAVWKKEWKKLTRSEKIWTTVRGLLDSMHLKSKFLLAYQKFATDDVIHPTYGILRAESDGSADSDGGETGTKQGRVAVYDPNLQQTKNDKALKSLLPASAKLGSRGRRKTGRNKLYVAADYTAGEVVTSAVAMDVKKWIERLSWKNPPDMYKCMANDLYHLGVSIEEENKSVHELLEKVCPKEGELRKRTKTDQLALLYGQSVEAFCKRTGVLLEEAKKFFAAFNEHYGQINQYRERIKKVILAGEPVRTGFRRQMFYNVPQKGNKYEYELAKVIRTAQNFEPQANLSDINFWQQYRMLQKVESLGWEGKAELCLLVHDSAYWRVDPDIVREFSQLLITVMEDVEDLPFAFPKGILRVAVHFGANLANMSKELDKVKLFRKFKAKSAELPVSGVGKDLTDALETDKIATLV